MRSTLALALFVSALPISLATAQSRFTSPPPAERQTQRQPQRAPRQDTRPIRWANMDRNGDRVITRAEWRGTAQAFEDADWNRDGILSGDEVARPDARAQQRPAGTASQQEDTRFQTLDGDRDGRLSRWEWPDSWQSFTALDQNNDDILTRAEVAAGSSATSRDVLGSNAGTAIPRSVGTSGDIVRIDPKERWVDTGLDVAAGDRLYFDAEGRLQLSDGPPDTSTPAGAVSGRRAANAPLPNAAAGALIARIGSSAPLLIGAQRTLARAPVSGRLYLGVNDDHLADNSGEYRVSVTIERR